LGAAGVAVVWADGDGDVVCRHHAGTLWSVVIATDNGVRTVPPIYSRAARTMGSKQLHTWVKVIVPASLPFIVSGMKQGWAFAWRSLMAAEIYGDDSDGIRSGPSVALRARASGEWTRLSASCLVIIGHRPARR